MNFIKSFIFNRTVLSLVVFACFFVTALDLFFDSSRTNVIEQTSIETAKNEAQIFTQLVAVYKKTSSADIAASSPEKFIETFNKELSSIGNSLCIKLVTPASAVDAFQAEALKILTASPNQFYFTIEEGDEQSFLRYAVLNTAFPEEKTPSILELIVPLGAFELIAGKEAIKTLWVLIIMAIVTTISMTFFVGYLRHASEVLAATQEKALDEQKLLTAAYERFFPHQFLDLLQKKSILDINLGDQAEKKMAVVFADIRNFTALIEKMTSAQSFQFINAYLGEVGPIIRQHSGFIDKYIGDAVMSLFEIPDNAILATIKIIELLHRSASKMPISVEVGIGIHFGSLMVGTVGEEKRMDGTVISDVVNTASRLEALNKSYGTHIIISDQVLDSLKNRDQFKVRYLDHIYVKGKTNGVKIFEIFNNDSPDLIVKKELAQPDLNKAMDHYRVREFKECIACLQSCQKYLPEDPLILLFLKRCNKFLAEGTPEGWEPIAKLSQKDVVE